MHRLSTDRAKRLSNRGLCANGARQVAALATMCLGAMFAATPCRAQTDSRVREISYIDANTRWAFRALSPVTIHSPIIRLGDVVQPLDPNLAAWQRLRRSIIGLVPIGGQPMTIQRDRLAKAIRAAEATPLQIDWIGPTSINVVYRQSLASAQDHPTRQVSYDADPLYSAAGPASSTARAVEPLPKMEADRILRWITLAIQRQYPSLAETYRIEIDRKQHQLVALNSIGGVTSIEIPHPIREGPCRMHVVARSVDGPVKADVDAVFAAHPTVAVPRKGLPRGHRIQSGDMTIKPLPSEEVEQDFVIDPDDAIGMEVRKALRADSPVSRGDLGAPILVHRGDRIEIRVVGGGITITTNAKALANGSESDLIEIETMQPRKRLLARVVQPGLVEIITRAPRVH
jgi:flagella basal body P-ring formation protein FlgA